MQLWLIFFNSFVSSAIEMGEKYSDQILKKDLQSHFHFKDKTALNALCLLI